jgi:hypothetical protein
MAATTTHAGPTLVDTRGAAEILHLTPRALEERRRRGSGPPFVRISPTCVRYRISDLVAWVEERTFTSTAEESAAEPA